MFFKKSDRIDWIISNRFYTKVAIKHNADVSVPKALNKPFVIIMLLCCLFPLLFYVIDHPVYKPIIPFQRAVLFLILLFLLFFSLHYFVSKHIPILINVAKNKIQLTTFGGRIIFYRSINKCSIITGKIKNKTYRGLLIHHGGLRTILLFPKRIDENKILKFFTDNGITCKGR